MAAPTPAERLDALNQAVADQAGGYVATLASGETFRFPSITALRKEMRELKGEVGRAARTRPRCAAVKLS